MVGAMLSLPSKIDGLSRTLGSVQVVAGKVRGGLEPYLRGDRFVARPWQNDQATGNPTATAFAAYLLVKAGKLEQAIGSDKALETFRSALSNAVGELLGSPAQPEKGGPETDTKETPNVYNTPILVAGLLASMNAGHFEGCAEFFESCKQQLGYVLERLRVNGGYLESLSARDYGGDESSGRLKPELPNAVHTFWAAAALSEARSVPALADLVIQIEQSLLAIGAWAERAVSEMLAWHFSGVKARFDPNETACAASLIYRCGKGRDARRLADKAVSVLFEEYFIDGQLAKSRPVFADRKNRVITCSTYETLSYLFSSAHINSDFSELPAAPFAYCEKAAEVASHIADSWLSGQGAPNDQDAHYGIASTPEAFSTSSAIAMVYYAARTAEIVLDSESKQELGIARIAPSRGGQDYPQHLRKIVSTFIVGKVNSREAAVREKAFYSMIWFGPPGTGKTSFARRIAADLDWSFLQITQKDFLVEGNDLIDACAERIFKLLLNVSKTVVLFDELEELVQAREVQANGREEASALPDPITRRLTTSMLPRIHDLRDRAEVVFIFATNRLKSLDPAATRLGRFDAIVPLAPLSSAERQAAFDKLIAEPKMGIKPVGQETLKSLARNLDFPAAYRGMIYKDIEFVVRQAASRLEEGETLETDDLRLLLKATTSIDDATLKRFNELCEKAQRPMYYEPEA